MSVGCATGRPEAPAQDEDVHADASAPASGEDASTADDRPVQEECAAITERVEPTRVPVDIIFVIDNSGSMKDETRAVRDRINDDFAEIVEASGVDYRIIMLTRYEDEDPPSSITSETSLCIGPPLSSRACDGKPDLDASRGDRFVHFSARVDSTNAWCVLIDAFSRSDEFGYEPWEPREGWRPVAPAGYQELLREGAFKNIAIISDEGVDCGTFAARADLAAGFDHPEYFVEQARAPKGVSVPLYEAAMKFDAAFRALSPLHFGSEEQRNYRVHTIVGLDADHVLSPSEPFAHGPCSTADRSPGNESLSLLTGGLRYSVCRHENYDEIFRALAKDTVSRSRLSCAWEIPQPPPGEIFDRDKVNLKYTSGTKVVSIPRVGSASECTGADAWFYDDPNDPSSIHVCPKTCLMLEEATEGEVSIALGCETIIL